MSLTEERRAAAQAAFEAAPIEDEIADCEKWVDDGVYWSIRVYWKNEDPDGDSIAGTFGVEFRTGTAEIIDQWQQ